MNDALWFHGDEATWRSLVETDYWKAVKWDHQDVEQEMDALDRERIRTLTPAAFLTWLHDRYFFWKYTQPNRLATTRNSLLKYEMSDPALTSGRTASNQRWRLPPKFLVLEWRAARAFWPCSFRSGSGRWTSLSSRRCSRFATFPSDAPLKPCTPSYSRSVEAHAP